jgi:hypothetical protein
MDLSLTVQGWSRNSSFDLGLSPIVGARQGRDGARTLLLSAGKAGDGNKMNETRGARGMKIG